MTPREKQIFNLSKRYKPPYIAVKTGLPIKKINEILDRLNKPVIINLNPLVAQKWNGDLKIG